MSQGWVELVRNPDAIGRFYTTVPPLTSITVRSLHFERRGPLLTMRFDLPEFPEYALPEWIDNECDTFQCQLRFLAVDGVGMRGWRPPVRADVVIERVAPVELRRIRVRVTGEATELVFSSSDSLVVGGMSAFRAPADGVDRGRHYYVGTVNQMRFETLPAVWEKVFYERI